MPALAQRHKRRPVDPRGSRRRNGRPRSPSADPAGSSADRDGTRLSPKAGRTSSGPEDEACLCSDADMHQLTRRPCSARVRPKQSCGRAGPDDSDRCEPVVRCATEAITRRPSSASRGSVCASSGRCSRPPRAARRLSVCRRTRLPATCWRTGDGATVLLSRLVGGGAVVAMLSVCDPVRLPVDPWDGVRLVIEATGEGRLRRWTRCNASIRHRNP